MMSKRVPIAAAKAFADKYDKDQVIVLCFSKVDGKTWVTTYGKTVEDCKQAAEGGNRLKAAMGWPPEECKATPARAKTYCVCGHEKSKHETGRCDLHSKDKSGTVMFACICTKFSAREGS